MLKWLKSVLIPNRRTFDRDPVHAEAVLSIGGHELSCRISDISPGGAFLAPALDLPIGMEAALRIPQIPMEAPVRIVRLTPGGVGIEFLQDNVGAVIAGWTRGRSPA